MIEYINIYYLYTPIKVKYIYIKKSNEIRMLVHIKEIIKEIIKLLYIYICLKIKPNSIRIRF